MSIYRRIHKENVIYICNGIFVSYGKEGNPTICNYMEGIILSEISQIEKDEYSMISLICEILKYCTQIQRTDWYLPQAVGMWTKWVEGDKKGTDFQL